MASFYGLNTSKIPLCVTGEPLPFNFFFTDCVQHPSTILALYLNAIFHNTQKWPVPVWAKDKIIGSRILLSVGAILLHVLFSLALFLVLLPFRTDTGSMRKDKEKRDVLLLLADVRHKLANIPQRLPKLVVLTLQAEHSLCF